MLSLHTKDSGVGDSGRLCHAGPHKAAEFSRGLISTAGLRRISTLGQTRFICFSSTHPSPTANSKYGSFSEPHNYYFYYNSIS